jgi:hypothetical protein
LLEARDWYVNIRVENTRKALERNGFEVEYYPTAEEALAGVLGMVPDGAKVGFGGSVTLREMGLVEALEKRDVELADHWVARAAGASNEEVMAVRRAQVNSDVFITSTNAVTETGELVNIDGTGQRVAGMIFGPKRVIVVAGVNKVTGDPDEREEASPEDAVRGDWGVQRLRGAGEDLRYNDDHPQEAPADPVHGGPCRGDAGILSGLSVGGLPPFFFFGEFFHCVFWFGGIFRGFLVLFCNCSATE